MLLLFNVRIVVLLLGARGELVVTFAGAKGRYHQNLGMGYGLVISA